MEFNTKASAALSIALICYLHSGCTKDSVTGPAKEVEAPIVATMVTISIYYSGIGYRLNATYGYEDITYSTTCDVKWAGGSDRVANKSTLIRDFPMNTVVELSCVKTWTDDHGVVTLVKIIRTTYTVRTAEQWNFKNY